jgi:hypothetical protein
MQSTTARLGLWSALAATAAWLIFTICFVGIAATRPTYLWTDLADYLAHARAYDQTPVYLAQACMLFMGPLYVLILCALLEHAPAERKTVLRAALALGVGFAVLTGINYFTHVTAVRFNITRGTTDGLEQFLQHKPDSVMAAINMLGWTVYFGLSSLLAAAAFGAGRLERALRIAFVANGVCCLLAGVGFVVDNVLLIYLTINLGMGGAVLVIMVLLCVFFARRLRGQSAARATGTTS